MDTLDRRTTITLGIGAFVVASMPLARRRPRRVTRRLPLMGTIAEIGVLHRDERLAQGAIDAAFERLRWVERVMTRFTSTSDVGRANLAAAVRPIRITTETAIVLREALDWAQTSEGEFDPCLGRAIELWDVTHRHRPPGVDRVRGLAGRHLYRALDVDVWHTAPVVRFGTPDVLLDLGGIAKGYGVDQAVETLRTWGVTDGLVNVGGDLYALGEAPEGRPWQVGIRSPRDPSRLAGHLAASDEAIATSGDYLQYFEYRGKRYHHLLDPETAAPRLSNVHSVSVVADTCMRADAAATAVFGLPRHSAQQLLAIRAPGSRLVELE